ASNVPYSLSVSCGAGGWMLDLAHEDAPERLVSGNESGLLAEYLRALAWVDGQVPPLHSFDEVLEMSAMSFPPAAFDIVSLCFIEVYTPTGDFPRLLQELARTCRSGGLIHWVAGTFPR